MRGLLALVLVAVLAALAPHATAQAPPIRWGDISPDEIAMTEVPGDPDATAIILGDVGFDLVEPARYGLLYTRRHHRRVKVLTEAGYEEGEFAFRLSDKAQLTGIRAQTFVAQPNGELRRVEVGRRDIFREDVRDGVEEVRFTMPALAPGAIFEYEYTYESYDAFVTPPTWYFRSSQPTVVSEYRVTVPEHLEYVTLAQGNVENHGTSRGYRLGDPVTEMRWSVRDVPALREEPYTTTSDDYTTRVKLQLNRVVNSNGRTQNVLTSWPEVAESLSKNDHLGRRLATSRLRRAQVEGLTGTRDERMRAVYDMIRQDYVSNGRGGIFAERDLNDVVETKVGTDPELTLLLAALLADAGVPAHVALLSTRANGRPVQAYPIVTQFDRLMVVAEMEDGTSVTLDPTDRHRPFGVLPVTSLNGAAWIPDPAAPRWIPVPSTPGTATTSVVQGTLGADGTLSGTLQLRLEGYDAQTARTRMAATAADAPARAAADAQAVAEATDADDGVTIEAVVVKGVEDVDAPLNMTAVFSAAAGESVAGDLYLTPFVLMQLDENPFERPTRAFPVDFAYPFNRTYIASIVLPDGYTVDELPPSLRMTIPSQSVSYTRVASAEAGRLTVRAVLRVDQAQIQPEEYPSLRMLYDEIVAAEAEAVLLVRAEVAPASQTSDAPADAGEGGR